MNIPEKLSKLDGKMKDFYIGLDDYFQKRGGRGGIVIDIFSPDYKTDINRANLLKEGEGLEMLVSKETKLNNHTENKLVITLRRYDPKIRKITEINIDYSLENDRLNMKIKKDGKTREYKDLTLIEAKKEIINR